MGTVMLFCTLGDCRIQDMCGTVCYKIDVEVEVWKK